MDKKVFGTILGVLSIITVIASAIVYYMLTGPDANIYSIVLIFHVLSIIGILFAIFSNFMAHRFILFIVGLIGNGLVLVAAYYLLFAIMGEA